MAVRLRPLVPARRAALAVATGLLLAGCSGDDDDREAESSPSASPTETVSESPSEPSPTDVAVGDAASITLSAGQRSGEASVTVTKVRQGTIKDLSDFVLDRRTRRSTPYYADVRVENTSDTNLVGATVPLWGLDSDGTVLPPAQIRGTFGKCNNTPMPKGFGKGKRSKTCLLFLVPRGRQLEAVQYRPNDSAESLVSWPAG